MTQWMAPINGGEKKDILTCRSRKTENDPGEERAVALLWRLCGKVQNRGKFFKNIERQLPLGQSDHREDHVRNPTTYCEHGHQTIPRLAPVPCAQRESVCQSVCVCVNQRRGRAV